MITSTRQYSLLDKMIMEVDVAARTLLGQVASNRENPANMVEDSELTERERAHSAGLMRVDHAGEVCAQALYRGQMSVAQSAPTYAMLEQGLY